MNFDLFSWWATVITGGIIFLTLVSVYLYMYSRNRREKSSGVLAATAKVGADFVFVWVLLSLLFLYIASIGSVSPILFALGNVVVEIFLIIYLLKNATKQT